MKSNNGAIMLRKKMIFAIGIVLSGLILFSFVLNTKQSSWEPAPKETKAVWILGHRCNANEGRKVSDLQCALNGGCNGVEVDIQWSAQKNCLVTGHDPFPATLFADTLEQFFARPELRNPRMCLIVFDVKKPKYLLELCNETHRLMEANGLIEKKLYIVYSVAKLKSAENYFEDIKDLLLPHEGVCIDFHNDAHEVEALYTALGIENAWYGNGMMTGGGRSPENSCRNACLIRDSLPGAHIKKVENWTINTPHAFAERLNSWHVDTLIVSHGMMDQVSKLLEDVPGVYLATDEDDPFH